MFGFIIGGLVGLIVGWNLPQPKWAKDLQNKVIKSTDDKI